jgi:NADH:ubiquinone oxidoreductase subunit K
LDDLVGSYLSLILLPIAGGESAIGLMIILQYYPKRGTVMIGPQG